MTATFDDQPQPIADVCDKWKNS